MELSQNSQISSNEKTKGFDLSTGKTWIYPENYPIRDYQFNIVQACLYNNTLVCLPTGLGKTFIAAVLMYNFWRWYPCGKVIFLAPTKPLVAQQIFACHNTMGIPSSESIELTGAVSHKQREIAWSKKRVIFATPQVFYNDLVKNVVPSDLVKCVVIDEAHKALGKHSYCECIRILNEKNQTFRVLALSATPGNKIDNVHEVLQNLLIAHVELRDETSLDIVPHINNRKIDIILVPLNNKLTEYKERYIFIMDRHVKILLQYHVLSGHTANISKGRVFHLLKEYQKKTNKSGNYGQIIRTLNILMTMYHAYELMIRDGLRAFLKFYQNHSDKFWMNEEPQLQTLLEDIKLYLGPFPDIKTSCEEELVEISQDLIFGHTKFDKLKELLLYHFKNSQEKQSDTRAIVFVEYRDIVSEIYILLLQCQPLIRPQMFVGKTGQKQKQQIKALEKFRNNDVNVLVSTSIGEEGLDVGEVDLIICFDVSQHSPIRLVQRMGRTGRKRDGHIIILVTDGREHETLKSTMARRDSLNYKILNTSNIFSSLYKDNPRMIPDIFTPECLKMHISVQEKDPVEKYKNDKGKSNKKEKGFHNILKKISNIDSAFKSQKDGTKFSIVKYFKVDQNKQDTMTNFEVVNSEVIQNNGICNTIKLSDVKILSCDNDAVDFLTTCALKISAKEENTLNKYKIDKSYIPRFPSIKNVFNFSIPDTKILDCLITLNIIPLNLNNNKVNNDNENDNKDDLYNNEYVFENTMEEIIDTYQQSSSKFEDLLDDSSKSNVSDLSDIEEKKFDINTACPVRAFHHDTENEVLKSVETRNKINMTQSLKPGKFEDILNETSDDSEISNNENFEQSWTKNINIDNNIQIKNSPNIVRLDDHSKSESGAHLQQTIEMNKFFFIPNQQCKHNVENYKEICKSTYPSKFNKSKAEHILSITQAIDEIARLNSNSIATKAHDESEDDIFKDENFLLQIDNQLKFDQEIGNSTNYTDEKNFNVMKNSNDKKNEIDTELKIEECEWDDDFQVSIDTVQDCMKFNTFEEERKSQKLVGTTTNMKTHFSDNEEWISVKDISKQNTSHTSIAKKLANVKKYWNSKHDSFEKYSTNKNNSMIDNQLTNAKEEKCAYFFDKSNNKKKYESLEKRTKYFRKHNYDRKLKKVKNEFICDEAEVSSNNDSTDENSETDNDLEGFVSYTQNIHDASHMHAYYLQSIKSPMKKQDDILFKRQHTFDSRIEIYSQPVTQIDESYINDSFCIAAAESINQEITEDEELSELEKAELKLEKRKRKRKRIREKESDCRLQRTKRKNIINYFNSSSEDETEKLRKEIKDDSSLVTRS
ncbi:PREDICTED: Fanconi anemia group M protein [Eufriesea mexicana]|uniref:Fanconi anemia group M protein n=1 Tax=Eufriesea mexicana TaxID=516756 RepID=UPI00083BCA68|nr:PREDICTED: Fanconi anemia group M protein [Eufriesea mexicana]